MPHNRIRLLAAALSLVGLFASPLFSQSTVVKGPDDLKTFAAQLLTAPDAINTIGFDYYQNPGQFKIDKPSAKIEMLQFRRANPDSEAVIKVDSTFLDIRNMATGTLALRGLAFKLMNPKAVLIAGFDNLKPNNNLIIDSCFIFSDSVDGAFLSWLGGPESRVDITNSWFVFKGGKVELSKMLLNAGTIAFNHNLINYPGIIQAQEVGKTFEFKSNTVNRTQLVLSGKTFGKLPYYTFNRNLFAHRHTSSAFGADLNFVASIGSFDIQGSSITVNRMYNTWTGFDYQNRTTYDDVKSNIKDTVKDGKAVGELWEWYTEVRDPSTGMLSGAEKRSRFNVMPDTIRKTLALPQSGTLDAVFKPAPYPRNIEMKSQQVTAVPEPPYRTRYPANGAITFGPFQIERITLPAVSVYGKPVLLAQDTDKVFKRQPGTARLDQVPSVYSNSIPTARSFILADSGNTPRGIKITPTGVALGAGESFQFGKVDSSGMTDTREIPNLTWPKNVRPLNRNFAFSTNAAIDDSVKFEAPPGAGPSGPIAPYHPGKDSIFWLVLPDSLIPVTRDSLRYRSTVAFNSKKGPVFSAYLVEKLSVPREDATLPIAEGKILSKSAAGYQIYIKSDKSYDKSQYAEGTEAYRINWNGRAAGDSLHLVLQGLPLSQAFVITAGGKVDSLPKYTMDTAGFFRIPIAMEDSGKGFFTAIKYNVLPGVPFSGTLGDVTVVGFGSTAGGKLAFQNEDTSFIAKLDPFDRSADSADFGNTRFLGGLKYSGYNLNPTGTFKITFDIRAFQDSTNIEVWYRVGEAWKELLLDSSGVTKLRMTVGRLPAAATRVVVVERFQDPEIYVTPRPIPGVNQVVFVLDTIMGKHPIQGYCVATRAVDATGSIRTTDCVKKFPTDSVKVELHPNEAFSYKVAYYMGSPTNEAFLDRPFKVLASAVWSAAEQLTVPLSKRPAGQWRLAGLPFTGLLGKVIRKIGPALPDSIRDTTLVYNLKDTTGGGAVFAPILDWTNEPVKPGKAILFAASRQTELYLDNVADKTRSAAPESLPVKAGWNLIGNPYPIYLPRSRVRSQPGRALTFYRLTRNEVAVKGSFYSWDTLVTSMYPFEGFAYYAKTDETLVFDPTDSIVTTVASVRPRKSASSSQGYRIQVGLQGDFGGSRMELSTIEREEPLGFLPMPGAGLEMRIGGKGGYWIKPVRDFKSVDEPVSITSQRAGVAGFSFGDGGQGAGMDFALIDETTGAIYDRASARELPVSAGTNAYRLLAGDAGFIAERTRAFLAGAPAEMSLSQNFPNPFRGNTRIALDWPATRATDRKASLEVLDMQGRRLAQLPIEGIKVGRQVLSLDASAWKPGIYVYRLTVTAGGRLSRLQKRMLVSP